MANADKISNHLQFRYGDIDKKSQTDYIEISVVHDKLITSNSTDIG